MNKMSGNEIAVRTNCRACGHGGCGVIAYVKDGEVTRINGDPDSPISKGYICSKGLASIQLAYHPDRLKFPLKRIGKKGEGQWQRISWDEALRTITNRLSEIKETYGAESVVVAQGADREYTHFLYRFANLFGTPNVTTAGHVCYVSRVGTCLTICGNLPVCDYDGNPKCIMVWGNNIMNSNPDEYKAINFSRALSKGAKLIVIDPRRTSLAEKADLWLQLRPGTDSALALSMLDVIIKEELYDKEFVEKYTFGFDKLTERAKNYPVEKAEEITSVPAEKIKEAARLYATTKPACIQWGVAIEQTLNCTSNNWALTCLMATTGNLDTPGGNAFFVPPPVMRLSDFALHEKLPSEQLKKMLGGEEYKLAARVRLCIPYLVWRAILRDEPYPVKAVLVFGSNLVITRANAKEVYEALSKLDFLVVADLFMTPTAELADIVLPAASWLEQNNVASLGLRHGYVFARQKVIEPVGECWSDQKIFNELGKKLGYKKYFWYDVDESLNYILNPAGITWDQFKEKGFLRGAMEYEKYKKKGFSTPTKKVELYSTVFEEWGYDTLPGYVEVPESPISKPQLANEYPFILITGARIPYFLHSEHRMVPVLRELHPDPLVEIHPETAQALDVNDGDWVYIETPRGRIKQKAKITPGIHPRVIHAEHGWWFPEKKDPGHGWNESNVDILTENKPPLDPYMGSTNLRVLLCRVYRCNFT